MKSEKKGAVSLVLMLMAAICTACGSSGRIRIYDSGRVTMMEATLPATVADVLAEANITLEAGDQTDPAPDVRVEGGTITILRQKTVTLAVDGEERSITTMAGTVEELLQEEGLSVTDGVMLSPDIQTVLEDDLRIEWTTQIPVEIFADGDKRTVYTQAATVEEVLKEQKIVLSEDDQIKPDADTAVTADMQITITRITYEDVIEVETVPFETVRQNDASIARGSEVVRTEGADGERLIFYRVTKTDGEETARERTGDMISKEPANRVILVGTRAAQTANTNVQPAPAQTPEPEPEPAVEPTPAPEPEPTPEPEPEPAPEPVPERTELYRINYADESNPGHGHYEVMYSDGTREYIEY